MPLVKYVANHDPANGSGRLRLKPSDEGVIREIELGGPAIEVSDEEYAALRGHYVLEEVDEEHAAASVVPELSGRPLDLTAPFAAPSPDLSGETHTQTSAEGGDDDHEER